MDDDNSFYNALIIALVIGIVVVIITLIVSRPAPERFTELYFNEHKLLPKYVTLGQQYQYSFTINNLERNDTTYNYNITEQLFRFDRQCETPNQYLEQVESSAFESYLQGVPQSVPRQSIPSTVPKQNQSYQAPPQILPGQAPTAQPSAEQTPNQSPSIQPTTAQVPTRRSESEDPALLIKSENFSVRFSERSLQGVGQVVTSYKSLDGLYTISAIINEETQKAVLIYGAKQSQANISIKHGVMHKIELKKKGEDLTMDIDGNRVISSKAPKISPGFISFETTNTFAQISGVAVTDNNVAQSATISYADFTSDEQYLLDDNHPGLFLAENATNASNYVFEQHFRFREGNQLATGIQGAFEIYYNQSNLVFNDEIYRLPQSRRNVHTLKAEVLYNLVTVWFDDKQIIEETPILNARGTPFLKTLGSDIDMRSMSISSLQSPQATRYLVPALETKLALKPIPLKAFQIGGKDNENVTEIVSDLFNQEVLEWSRYYLTARYVDTYDNGTLTFSFYGKDSPYYVIKINNKDRNATVGFISNNSILNKTFDIQPIGTPEHEFNIDISNQLATFIIDNEIVLNTTLDRATGGVILLNVSNDIDFQNIIIQDKDNPVVRIFEKKVECQPILIAQHLRNASLFLQNNDTIRMNESVSFKEVFDIAKVQVSLDKGQEVHFWVTRT